MLKHGVRETTTTAGTGTVTLVAASGYSRAADRFSVGQIMDYLILDNNGNKEWGFGTVGAANTLARTTIAGTLSAGVYAAGGAALSLSGSAVVACVEHEVAAGANIASAATVDLTAATGTSPRITGITATSAVTMNEGQWALVVADGAWPLTYHATTNKLNTAAANYTLTAGDMVLYNKDKSGIVHGFIIKADGTAVVSAASGVTSVSGTAPVVSSGGSTPAISIPAATASVAGHMTAAQASKLAGIAAGATVGISVDVGVFGVGVFLVAVLDAGANVFSAATVAGSRLTTTGLTVNQVLSGTWRNISSAQCDNLSTGFFQRIS